MPSLERQRPTVVGKPKDKLNPKIKEKAHALPDPFPQPWASDWGEDEYGVWMGFEINSIRQALRWIPPGEFIMGSPDHEVWSYDNEGPRHPVRFVEGFWLAETVCTQALWQAVMGENPSRFQGKEFPEHCEHPVERVSWDKAQVFITRLNERVSGLNAQLPSEAKWEYACRAGTKTRYAFGDNVGLMQAQFGQDWEEGSTAPVNRFDPNDWGLYQMHGNVWEFCEDCWHNDYKGAPVDGAPWLEAHGGDCEYRVVRGGSWLDHFMGLRSACRDRRHHDESFRNQGFRLSRSHQT